MLSDRQRSKLRRVLARAEDAERQSSQGRLSLDDAERSYHAFWHEALDACGQGTPQWLSLDRARHAHPELQADHAAFASAPPEYRPNFKPILDALHVVLASRPCRVCQELIRGDALKCRHCGSYQTWRRLITDSSSVLALLVAFVSVLSLTLALVAPLFIPKRANLGVSRAATDQDGLPFAEIFNHGQLAGQIKQAVLRVGEPPDLELNLEPNDRTIEASPNLIHTVNFAPDSVLTGELESYDEQSALTGRLVITVQQSPNAADSHELDPVLIKLPPGTLNTWAMEILTPLRGSKLRFEVPATDFGAEHASVSDTDEGLTVVSFNLESGDADPVTLGLVIADIPGVDIWGFSEVQPEWLPAIVRAAKQAKNGDFEGILGSTGANDRLMIVYDASRLDLVEKQELGHINPVGRARVPLIAHLQLKSTGEELLFVVNHLYRSRANQRHIQSDMLREWAAAQVLPVIFAGDYNYDWDVLHGDVEHDEGYDLLTANQTVQWVRPERLVPTICNDRYPVILDFIFVAGGAKSWPADSSVLRSEPSYCPDTAKSSDHRPVMARFRLPLPGAHLAEGAHARDAFEDRLNRLEEEISEMRKVIRRPITRSPTP